MLTTVLLLTAATISGFGALVFAAAFGHAVAEDEGDAAGAVLFSLAALLAVVSLICAATAP